MAKYIIPDQMKVKNIGVGWGGEPPKKMQKTVMKQFKAGSGGVKGFTNKQKKTDKAGRLMGF